MTSVTCLIPAYNEAARLPAVLAAVVGHPWIDEVLVIDDGSTDETSETARRHSARVLTLSANGGKSSAVAAGIEQVRTEIILLMDADLGGLTVRHVSDLLTPLRTGLAGASVSLRSNAPLPWRMIGLDYISGERALFTASIRPHLGHVRALRGFGLEVFLNGIWLREGYRIAVVPLPDVSSPSKLSKRGIWRGVLDDLRMLRDIFRTIGVGTAIYQIAALRGARVQ